MTDRDKEHSADQPIPGSREENPPPIDEDADPSEMETIGFAPSNVIKFHSAKTVSDDDSSEAETQPNKAVSPDDDVSELETVGYYHISTPDSQKAARSGLDPAEITTQTGLTPIIDDDADENDPKKIGEAPTLSKDYPVPLNPKDSDDPEQADTKTDKD
jgi:hypothetical protein